MKRQARLENEKILLTGTDQSVERSEVSRIMASMLSTILVWNWVMFITLARSG